MRIRGAAAVILLTAAQMLAADRPPKLSPEVQKKRQAELAAAQRAYDKNPRDADAIIWLGRRLGYIGRYRDAIAVFTDGIRIHPRDARMYRHRGHRYITVRDFDRAVQDLERATKLTRGKKDQIEPDGIPNARNIPIGSLQSNICYHLGLAYYLKGDFDRALPVYRRCAAAASNPDRLVSTTHWLYMTLRRLGHVAEAEKAIEPISSSLDVIENAAYHKLLLMYRGDISVEDLLREPKEGNDAPTILYGIGNWYLYNGDTVRAEEIFKQIVAGDTWPAFGHIAAEMELRESAPSSRSTGAPPTQPPVLSAGRTGNN
jgi:tetratricopeptide (TPR) repeat protein